jgi:hypothetical protein
MPTTMEMPSPALTRLRDRLTQETRAEVYFDRGRRGLYATDASLYQIEPIGVVVPRTARDSPTSESRRLEQPNGNSACRNRFRGKTTERAELGVTGTEPLQTDTSRQPGATPWMRTSHRAVSPVIDGSLEAR